MKATSCIVYLLLSLSLLHAQPKDKYPMLGKRCPDFYLNDVEDFRLKQISKRDLLGKWTIMYFWSASCSASVVGLREMQMLQDKFLNDIQCVVIGEESIYSRQVYRKVKQLYNLRYPVAFDSILVKKFGIEYDPHVMIIDPGGTVRAITYRVVENDIRQMIQAQSIDLPIKPNKNELALRKTFDFNKALLLDGNGGDASAFTYRSLFAPWRKAMGSMTSDYIDPNMIRDNYFQFIGANLEWLYRVAYGDTIFSMPLSFKEPTSYGKLYRKVIFELEDTSAFVSDFITGTGVYAYSLTVPKGKPITAISIQHMLQHDLKNAFGYDVSVEQRMMPYWRLARGKTFTIAHTSTGGEPALEYRIDQVTLKNQPVDALIPALWLSDQFGPPIINETGLSNIDLTLEAIFTDREDVKRALQEKGFLLQKSKKLMRVIVIHKPQLIAN